MCSHILAAAPIVKVLLGFTTYLWRPFDTKAETAFNVDSSDGHCQRRKGYDDIGEIQKGKALLRA